MNNRNKNKGFSLVELIVVIAIMAVLVGVLAPTYLKYVEESKIQKDVSAIGEIVAGIKLAAANEDALKIIPSESVASRVNATKTEADQLPTLVTIAAETGVVDAETKMPGDIEVFKSEVIKNVGETVNFETKDLQEHGVDLKVTKDSEYRIHVYIESYNYSEKLNAALSAYFSLYHSDGNVVDAIYKNWSSVIGPILEEGGLGSGLKALDKLTDLMYNKKTETYTIFGKEYTREVTDWSSPTADGQKVLDYVASSGESAVEAVLAAIEAYMENNQ